MYFKKIFMDQMGSLSYFIGCPKSKVACVVNPSKERVIEYIETANQYDMEITHIFDTSSTANHFNGNMELKLRTEADIFYLRNGVDMFNHFKTSEGDIFDFGNARLEIINSPRHDPYVNSIMVTDSYSLDTPWLVLKQESLFMGDIGEPEKSGMDLSNEVFNFIDFNTNCPSGNSEYDKYPGYSDGAEYAAQSIA
jgi:hydroxyacylglutathione hydrolase